MSQPITINTAVGSTVEGESGCELSASSVSSIDWSISSTSQQSEDDNNFNSSTQRTPSKSSHRVSLAFTDLSSATGRLSLNSDDDTDQSPCTSPARARVMSGSTAPTSLLSDDKPNMLDSSDDEDGLVGGRAMAASVPNSPACKRQAQPNKERSRPRAQTDVANRAAVRRGSKQLNIGVLDGAAADEVVSWINASPSPFEPSTPLTATALSAVGSVVDCLPPSGPSGDNTTPRKLGYGFIPGPGVTRA